MPTPKLQRSTEHGGVGQSGYTAGRTRPDPALEREILVRNSWYPHRRDAPLANELETDDRWIGRGGCEPDDDDATEPRSPVGTSAPWEE